jgi:hypothetical protein
MPYPFCQYDPTAESIIIQEIVQWRCQELMARRNPTEISLTAEQKDRLNVWFDSILKTLPAPDGSKRLLCEISRDQIFGMKII